MTPEDRARIRMFLDRLQPLPFKWAAILWDELEAHEVRGERALAKRRRYLERRQAKRTAEQP